MTRDVSPWRWLWPWAPLAVAALTSVWAAKGSAGPTQAAVEPPLPSLVVLPDTQYYAAKYTEAFTAQTRWIVNEKSTHGIAAAVQLGDIVDNMQSAEQWHVATSAMRLMDGRVPYLLVPGNHDTDVARIGPIDHQFAPSTMPWLGGTMVPGHIQNSFMLVDVGPRRWLILGLEFGPRDTALAWADTVLKAHADLPAIIVTHAYLYEDGTRYGASSPGVGDAHSQHFSPDLFGYTPNEGINDGEEIWNKLIVPNANVRLVLCGHDNGVARLTSRRPDGSRVHQILSDYQWLYRGTRAYAGGSGYLRILEFDYDERQIHVETYSPYLQQYLTDDGNRFTLSLEP